jgi:hypothetical protein
MRALMLAFVILGMTTIAHAFDLGDALKQLGQPEDPATGAAKEGTPEKKTKKKALSLTELPTSSKGHLPKRR